MDVEDVKQYIALSGRAKELGTKLDSVKEEIAQLQDKLLKDFEREGVANLTVDGRTVYLHRQLWARARPEVERHEITSALKRAGLGQFVSESFNMQTLSAWVRELEAAEEALPPELSDVLTTSEVWSLRVRKAG